MSLFLDSGSPEHRPGVRAGLHEPDRLWPWVFAQHQVWVDIHGSEHEIELMPPDYLRNVIAFCQLRATLIRQLVEFDQLAEALASVIQGQSEAAVALYAELTDRRPMHDEDWLQETPLLRALRRSLDPPHRLRGPAHNERDDEAGQAQ